MTALPPSWALGAVGIDGRGDPHLAPGVHLRVLPGVSAGLPIRPFVVYRMHGDNAERELKSLIHTEITWVDSGGRILTPPFAVTPRNPVVGHIIRPPGVRAIAVAVVADREGGFDTGVRPGAVGRPEPGAGGLAPFGPDLAGVAAPPPAGRPAAGSPVSRPPGADGRPAVAVAAGQVLAMDAFIDTPQGRRAIGRRTAAPYALAAPDIHGVVMSGSGTVRGAVWVAGRLPVVDRLKPFMLLDLPVPAAARYEGLPDARDRAEKRVRTGAPTRFGLHDDPQVSGPAGATAADPDDEWKRVEALSGELAPYLDQVLEDLALPPADLTRPQVLSDGVRPGAFAQAAVFSLRAVLSAAVDPGMARWLGLAAVDDDPQALATGLTIYFVRGFVAIDAARLELAERLTLALAGGRLEADLATPSLPFKVPMTSADGLPVYDFTVPVVVIPGAPPARPLPPLIGAPLAPATLIGPKGTTPPATADGQGPWLAEFVPPAAGREVVLPLAALTAAPSLAAARREGATLRSLNERHPDTGRALALVPAVPENAAITGRGELADRAAPPDPVAYRVAQADWFGRWSEWNERAIPAKERALPPAPVFDVHYVLAAATPVDDAPRFGTLNVRLRVPRPEDLAPGARLLTAARVEAVIGGVAVSATGTLSSPTQGALDIVVPGPAGMIPRAGQVLAQITARWSDGVAEGPPAETQERTLADPRPPVALVLDPTLRYSARPDAVGRARMVLEWAAAAGVRYRVYATDETRLRGALAERAAAGDATSAGLMDALDAAPTAAHRGAAYTASGREGLYTRDLFTNLTAEPLAPPAGPARFSHDLSGSLAVLAFYKVVALSADNVESPFTAATLLPVAVPSGGPPPRPILDFLGVTDAGGARLAVTAVRGPQPAARWRLRRSVAESADALRMPIVAEGTVPAAGGEGPAAFEIVDSGLDPLAGGALPPWTRMSWRVEVQAASPPGSTLPGEWSPASGAAGGMLVPPAPAAAANLAIDAEAGDAVTLSFRHPDPLRKGSQGGYRFDLYRRAPGGAAETLVASGLADDPGVVSGSGAARTFRLTDPGPAPAASAWRVVVLDPAGRLSPPSDSATRPPA